LPIFVGREYLDAWRVIPPLALASICSRLYIFAPGLDIEKKTRLIMLINLGAALLNVALCFLLIPPLGLTGAALSTLLAAFSGFVAYMACSQRFYPVPHAWRPLIVAFAGNLIAVGVGLSLRLSPTLGLLAKVAILLASVGLTFRFLGAGGFLRARRNFAVEGPDLR
jgi:O-antigen/teichoic acid export membrane protein